MNRFHVKRGAEADFEAVRLNCEIHLTKESGFVASSLLRGPERDDHTLYVSHTVWETEADFVAWTRSDAFRRAHKDAGKSKPLYLSGPQFEGFVSIQAIGRDA